MFPLFMVLFIIVPALELTILIKLSQLLGILWTFLLIVFTGILGVTLAKRQGLMVLNIIRNQLNNGIMPSDAVIEGLLILAGSLFLLTPGILTDITGFLTLIPLSRLLMREFLKNKIHLYISNGTWRIY